MTVVLLMMMLNELNVLSTFEHEQCSDNADGRSSSDTITTVAE